LVLFGISKYCFEHEDFILNELKDVKLYLWKTPDFDVTVDHVEVTTERISVLDEQKQEMDSQQMELFQDEDEKSTDEEKSTNEDEKSKDEDDEKSKDDPKVNQKGDDSDSGSMSPELTSKPQKYQKRRNRTRFVVSPKKKFQERSLSHVINQISKTQKSKTYAKCSTCNVAIEKPRFELEGGFICQRCVVNVIK